MAPIILIYPTFKTAFQALSEIPKMPTISDNRILDKHTVFFILKNVNCCVKFMLLQVFNSLMN